MRNGNQTEYSGESSASTSLSSQQDVEDDQMIALVLSEEYAKLDGAVARRLTNLEPVPHVPRINSFIPTVNDASMDHQRLLQSFKMASSVGISSSLSATPIITSAKLNWKNYLSWSSAVELWFLGQGHHDHLEQDISMVPEEEKSQWQKLDFQLCAVLWQSVEQDVLDILRPYKTCSSFWKRAQDIFANDVQRLFDATQRVASLKQVNHDMVSHIAKAWATVEELKNFFVADSLEGINKKLDKFYMVLILGSLHSDYDHVRDQVLAGDQIPSMDGLVTRLLRVPTLVKDENSIEVIGTSAMIMPQGRGIPQGRGGGRSNRGRGGRSIRPQCTYCKKIGHTRDKCYVLHGYPDKVAHASKSGDLESRISNEEYEEFLRYKSGRSSNPGQSSTMTSVPTANLSQSMEGHSPWILDSGASDHISGTWDESSDWRRT